ncbi:NUDIX domain-containing protein [archaeon]|nr:NUDIX domain-containing protein [archaeon]
MEIKKLNDALKEKTKVQIITFLMRGDNSYSKIMKNLDEKDSGRINYHLKSLRALGLIQKNEGGIYELTSEGEKFAMYSKQFQLKEQYPIPVVCCEVEKEGNILLAKKAKKPYIGYWLHPGGKVDHGESVFETCRREMMEECGAEVKPQKIKGIYPSIFKDKEGNMKHHIYLIHVECKFVKQHDHIIEEDSDVSEYKWFTKEELNKLDIIPSNRIFFDDSVNDIHEQTLIG